jgi:hypothetical protein
MRSALRLQFELIKRQFNPQSRNAWLGLRSSVLYHSTCSSRLDAAATGKTAVSNAGCLHAPENISFQHFKPIMSLGQCACMRYGMLLLTLLVPKAAATPASASGLAAAFYSRTGSSAAAAAVLAFTAIVELKQYLLLLLCKLASLVANMTHRSTPATPTEDRTAL